MTSSVRSPRKVARRLRILPLARRELCSWPRFMTAYALGLVPRRPYEFRSGARLKVGRGVDHVPIVEVFLRRDYGDVSPGATVLDLGASTGVFAVFAAASAPGARIIAYEPMRGAFELLVENVRRNDADVVCHNAAVTATGAEAALYIDGEGLFFPSLVPPASRARSVSVPSVTLEQVLERDRLSTVDLLKLDIEGAEYEVLYNTPRDCLDRIAEIRMEAHDLDTEDRNARALERFLAASGFRITRAQREPTGVVLLWAAH